MYSNFGSNIQVVCFYVYIWKKKSVVNVKFAHKRFG